MFKRLSIVILASVSLSGCGSVSSMFSTKVDCMNEDGHQTAISLIQDNIEKRVGDAAKNNDHPIAMSKVRATIAQLKFTLEDVRTSKEDPNSTKKFCASKLKVTFPEQMLADASKVAELLSLPTLDSRADDLGAERNANAFKIDLDFAVQPTDDGKKVYAEIDGADKTYDFISGIVGSSLFRKRTEQSMQDQVNQEQAEQQYQENAQNDSRRASFDEAKATNQLAEQSINAVWAAIPDWQRQNVLPIQRAWIKRKGAECRIEAASTSVEPTERETARLNCEARWSNERAGELQQLVSTD